MEASTRNRRRFAISKVITLSTSNYKGWNIRVGSPDAGSDLSPGDGVSIVDGVISLSPTGANPGEYRFPIITVDEFGRVTDIKPDDGGSLYATESVNSVDDLELYQGTATALIVREVSDGRSAVFTRSGENWVGPFFLTGLPGRDGADGENGINGADGERGEKGERGDKGG